MDRELARILDVDFLADVSTAAVDDLRERRTECQRVETALSYLRRLTQGRLDIVAGELDRREQGGDPHDLGGLIERLPEILSDRGRGTTAGHVVEVVDPGQVSGELVEELAQIDVGARLTQLGEVADAELRDTKTRLAALEGRVSGLRRELFDRIDRIQAELAHRYETGEASVDRLLTGD